MRIAIVGAGNVGAALGKRWAAAGHSVVYGVRDPDADKVRELLAQTGPNGSAKSIAAAAEDAELMLLAVPFAALRDVATALSGYDQVVVDATNPLKPDLSGLEELAEGSAAHIVASAMPQAKVVKAFNTTGSPNMDDSDYPDGPPSMPICGDEADAKAVVADLAHDVGFEPFDFGPLSQARRLEELAMLWISTAFGGRGPNFAFRILTR